MTEARRISTDEVQALLDEGYRILDVRTEGEYEAGHPAGAYNIPVMHAAAGGMVQNGDFVAVVKAHFPTDTPLLLACRSGNRSMTALRLLEAEGYTDLVDLRPGWSGRRGSFGEVVEAGWSQSDLPQETASPGRAYVDLLDRE